MYRELKAAIKDSDRSADKIPANFHPEPLLNTMTDLVCDGLLVCSYDRSTRSTTYCSRWPYRYYLRLIGQRLQSLKMK